MSWRAHFDPWRRSATVLDIDYDALWDDGVRGIVFDLENTIALYRATGLIDGCPALLRRLQEKGFSLAVVSNSVRTWVDAVCTPLGIPFVGKAGKPRRRAFRTVLDRLGLPPGQVVVVGDQLLTDMYGAQRLGMRAILVDPLGPDEPWTSRLQRRVVPRLLRLLPEVRNFNDK